MSRETGLNTRGFALVTGASSGIGLEYARQLASMGYDLLAVSNQKEQLEACVCAIEKEFEIKAVPLCLDLAVADAAERLFSYCIENGITVDILINNAGVFIFNDIVDTSPQRLETMMVLHMNTVTMLCRLFGSGMKSRGRGYILNMSSLSAWMPVPGIALYGATKAYIRNFSRAMHHEMKPFGVGVTAVCPGGVSTGLYGLAPRYQRLGVRLGVLCTPERLVKKALRAMFARREIIVPGLMNKLFVPVMAVMPGFLIRALKNRLSEYEH